MRVDVQESMNTEVWCSQAQGRCTWVCRASTCAWQPCSVIWTSRQMILRPGSGSSANSLTASSHDVNRWSTVENVGRILAQVPGHV